MTAKAPRPQNGNPPGISNGQDIISLQVTLPQMLDLALGTPEAMINTSKAGPSLQLHEYSITDSSSKTTQRERNSQTELNAEVYTSSGDASKSGNDDRTAASAPVTARGKNGSGKDRSGAASGAKRTRGSKQQIGTGMNGERQSVIFVEPVVDGVAPTGLAFKGLEETVLNLQQRFEALDELANDPEMIERVRTSKSDPLSDMWNVINIKKRLDGCEKGIEKLTTMVQDLIKSDKIEISGGVEGSEELGHLNERIVELENQLSYLSGDMANLMSSGVVEDKKAAEPSNSVNPPASVDGKTAKTATPRANEKQSSKVPSKAPSKSPSESSSVGNESEPSQVPSADTKPDSSKGAAAGNEPEQSKGHPVDNEHSNKVIDPAGSGKSSNVKKKKSQTLERRSVIGGVDLSELKSEVSTLKSDVIGLRKNLQDLSVKVVGIVDSPRPIEDPAGVKVPVIPSVVSAAVTETAIEAVPNVVDDPSAVSSVEENKETAASAANLPIAKPGASKASAKRTEPHVSGKDQADNSKGVSRDSPFESKSNGKKFNELESRVSELEKEIGCVNEKLNVESLKALGVDGKGGIGDLVAKLQALQADVDKMNETASRLMDEKENREFHTNALIEQIELLKTIKADKEDLEDALADKADAHAVNRKVSHDQFDAACDDLARGLEDAITKLSQQECVWQQALDDVQREIEGKLDKIEISPLKEFVNNRLKMLQEKLKTLAEMRRENEAAGTKKMLSDVQCISCDSNVVMRMDAESATYRAPALPCTKSIKPYLTYELDQVRKQQRRLPTSRNMIQFEAAMQEMARKSKPLKDDFLTKSPRDHLCNRYCGGSHTITTPQQRVMRMGHFLTQWGPEAIQLTEGVIRGNDGQLYRSRPMPGKPEATKTSNEGEGSVEIPPATSRATILEHAAPQRQSQISRGRSLMSQASKRLSARKTSESLKETKPEETTIGPSTPPDAPPGTIVDDGETMIPEPPAPTDEVVREPSLEEDHNGEEEILTEPDD